MNTLLSIIATLFNILALIWLFVAGVTLLYIAAALVLITNICEAKRLDNLQKKYKDQW